MATINPGEIMTWIFGVMAAGCVVAGLAFYGIAKMTDSQNGLAEGKMVNFFIAAGVCTAAAVIAGTVHWTYGF
jgi:hypothetical protein